MDLHHLLHFLIICTVVNYAVLIIWFAAFTIAHDRLYRLHSRWFKMSVETFDTINYSAMAIYKVGIMIFNVAPLVALHFV